MKKTNTFSPFKLDLLKKTLTELLKANNSVSTLEIKIALRTKYPKMIWNQQDISNAMNSIYLQGDMNITYNDNGIFRVYSYKTNQIVNKKSTNKMSGTKSSKISKAKALEIMQNSNGRFFGVTFTKKDGTERKMRCRLETQYATPTYLGYLKLIDVKNKTPKSVNLQTLSEIRINGSTYNVI